ncbi:MAG: hypothetical protein KKF33_20360, partial [Alphaproteobacteria bacterium]|nr:hypothetical protein [Alphaproteobacteria bacterium]
KDETFTASTRNPGGMPDKFRKVGTALKQCTLPNRIRSTTDPTNAGTWASEITVGEFLLGINDLQNHLELLYCIKENGVYYISNTTVYHPFASLEAASHADFGKNSDVFQNKLYFRIGHQQEREIDGTTITDITPEISASGISQYTYECVARAHDEAWLYAIMKRASNDYAILAGRWEYIAGEDRWIWHEIASGITLSNIVSAMVSSVEGRPYLYLGGDGGLVRVYLPVTNDATADSGYRFCLAGSLYSPRYMTALHAFDKRWLELFARSASLSGTNYITAYKSIDDGANFTWLGGTAALSKIDTSPEETLDYPADIEETMMNLRFDFVGDSETVPPVLKYYNIKAMTMVPSVVRFYHTIKCADGLLLKDNHHAGENYTASDIRTFLDTIRDKVCTLGDRWGTEHTVKVRVSSGIEVFDEDTQNPEMAYSIEAVKL